MINLDEQHHCYINGVKQSRAKVNGNVVWRNCDVLESVSGQSRQSNLPDGYTEYTSVTDTDGNIYTSDGTTYPAMRISDNVFGLYNTSTNVFKTEV